MYFSFCKGPAANQGGNRCQLKRQKRTNFSSYQRYELEMAFKHSQYLTPQTSRKLGKLGISDEKIKVTLSLRSFWAIEGD